MVKKYSERVGKYSVEYVMHGHWAVFKNGKQIGYTSPKAAAIKKAKKLNK